MSAQASSRGIDLLRSPRYEDNTTVRVLVGPTKSLFNVHKQFVCCVSPFFDAACNSQFKEALDDEVCLPEGKPESFDIFLEWIYTRAIRISKHPPAKDDNAEVLQWWIELTNAYFLAQYLQSAAFGNAVIDFMSRSILRKQVHNTPIHKVAMLVYTSTVNDCGLRRLLIAWLLWRPSGEYWAKEQVWKDILRSLPAEFSQDLAIKSLRMHHQLEENPFLNEKTCQVFRDAENQELGKRTSCGVTAEEHPTPQK